MKKQPVPISSIALGSLIMVVFLSSGCTSTTPPESRHPVAGLSPTNSTYKNMSIGLIFSDNTKNAQQYVDRYMKVVDIRMPPEQLFEDIVATFQKHFKTVVQIKKVEEGKALNVDLIAVLDVYVRFPSPSLFPPLINLGGSDYNKGANVDVSAVFLTPDHKQIDVLQAQGAKVIGHFSAMDPLRDMVYMACDEVIKKWEIAVSSSVKLAEFAKSKDDGATMIAAQPQRFPAEASSTLSEIDRLPVNDPRGVKVIGKAPAEYVTERFGKSWAVVIGIDDYEKAPRLKYAVADAKAMAAVLRQQGFQVSELYNRQATKAAVEGELSDKLVDQVGQQDRVVIFYAGHGETKTASGGKTMGYLLPVEGQPEALGRTGVSMGRIKELADALPSKQVLFLVDVCYGGIAGNQFRSTLPPMTVAYLKQITRERGRQLITAGGPDQQALESPEWGHSVFTYYLLEGLNGLADLNDDGIIPASELYSYLDSRVFSAAQLKGHVQRPELWSLAAEKGEFVFIPAKQKVDKVTQP